MARQGRFKGGTMTMVLKKNLSMGVFSIFMAIIVWILSYTQIDPGYVAKDSIHLSSRTFPLLAAALLGIFGSVNLIMSLVLGKESSVKVDLKAEAKVLIVFAGFVLYMICFRFLGFIICTSLVSCFILFLEGNRNRKHYLILVALTVVGFLIFRYGLQVSRLPWGYPLVWIFG